MTGEAAAAFVRTNTTVGTASLVPEIRCHLASAVTPLWQATEANLAEIGLPPPYWAFCWPGGQALARYVLDRPAAFRGRRVLDFASGSGIAAIAAARTGAAVEASEIDRFAAAAIALNAALNAVAVRVLCRDVTADDGGRWDVVLAGDVFYEKPMAERVWPWLRALAGRGCRVLIGDPGRSYLPRQGLRCVGGYDVPTSVDLEDAPMRHSCVWQVEPAGG